MEDSQFDQLSRAYESTWSLPFRQHLERYSFFKLLGSVEGKSVLDVGCGSGIYTREIKRRGASRVTGLDISTMMIEFAKLREREDPLGIEFVNADMASAASFGAFDVVTGIYVLPYAETREHLVKMCKGAAAALREGGRFVSMPVNPGFYGDDLEYYMPYGLGMLLHGPRVEGAPVTLAAHFAGVDFAVTCYHWSKEAHESALREAGFRRVTWHHPEVTEQGMREQGEAYWKRYLDQPHALLIECIK